MSRQKIGLLTREDPPERPPQYDWTRIAAQLKGDPMRWYKVFDGDRTSVVVAIRSGSIRAVHPDLGFEVQTSNNVKEPRRTCTLHMRYNPDRVDGLRAAIRKDQ